MSEMLFALLFALKRQEFEWNHLSFGLTKARNIEIFVRKQSEQNIQYQKIILSLIEAYWILLDNNDANVFSCNFSIR